MSARRLQHSKGKHRPRRWHMGQAQGVINERLLTTTIEPAFAAAAQDRQEVEVVSLEHRRQVREHLNALKQLDRVAPFVPRWEISL